MDKVNLHLREGSILPLQKPNTTTYASRQNGFELRAAINSNTGNATGSLYWDDGDDIGKKKNFVLHRRRVEVPLHTNVKYIC